MKNEMTKRRLSATYQKSYYNKAFLFEDDDFVVLRSYNTDVAAIDKTSGEFKRLWNGFSNTTKRHINDFRKCYGCLPLSKKEWMQLPCVNAERVYNVYISTGWTTHRCPALLTEAEAEREAERIQKNDTRHRFCVWYE